MVKKDPKISVIIPVYNECNTILEIIKSIRLLKIKNLEIVVVDDGSKDGTVELLKKNKKLINQLILRPKNGGKGQALQDGVAKANGDIFIFQDADLEYDPHDYPKLLAPVLSGRADVVFGSRFVGSQPHRVVYFWHFVANWLLTNITNMVANVNYTDMETGYKVFKREVFSNMQITERSFGIEPEIAIKVARNKWRIYEVGISYHGRTYDEGKKIGPRDAIRAIWVILKFGILEPADLI